MTGELDFRPSIVVSREPIYDTHRYSDIAKQIAQAMREFTCPVTVELSGSYGSGKSSIVAMALGELGFGESEIRGVIEERKSAILWVRRSSLPVAVFFDAGLWEDVPDLFGALLLSILSQKEFQPPKELKAALQKVLFGGVIFLRVLGKTQVGLEDFRQFKELTTKEVDKAMRYAEDRQSLREATGEVFRHIMKRISEQTESQEPRLILILDNLDRVSPEQTLSLLKSIYLFIPKSINVFILACVDREFLEHYLAQELGIRDSTAYLSKYIDFFWGMPMPKRDPVNEVISKLLENVPEDCFKDDKYYPKVLAGMIHKAGVTTPRLLEMAIKRLKFLLIFYWERKQPEPTLGELYKEVKNKRDLLNSGFGVKVAALFYLSLMFLRWPWLYDGFYLLGLSGEEFKTIRNIEHLIQRLILFCGTDKPRNDPYVRSFLTHYYYMTLYSNPGAALAVHFRPPGNPEEYEYYERLKEELRKGACLAGTHSDVDR